MNVTWNAPSVLARWISIIFFLGVLPPLSFFIGTQYEVVMYQFLHPPVVYPDPKALCQEIQNQEKAALDFKAAHTATTTATSVK